VKPQPPLRKSGMNTSITDILKRVAKLQAAYATAVSNVQKLTADLVVHKANHTAAMEAQKIVQALAESIQQEAHGRIAGVVSRCLAAVFEDPYEFRIVFEQTRGRTEARLVFVRDGVEVNPIDSSGGGVVDVAAFALRLSCLMLSRPARRRVVVMDEPFRFVSKAYRPAVAVLLEQLAKELAVQFIIVTHFPELAIGRVHVIGA
jgi:DNA repair exonuclease SbcCD ATPase subunit